MDTSITLIIPTYNRAESLRAMLASVAELHIPPDVVVDVLVINNCSMDETSSVIAEAADVLPLPIHEIVETEQGLQHARNRGLQESKAGHVAFFDDDVRIAPEWIEGYLEAIEKTDAVCVVGPVQPVYEHRDVPAFISPRTLRSVSSAYSQKGDELMVLPPEVSHEITGCGFGVLRRLAIEVGGFDVSMDRIGRGLLAGGDTAFGLVLNHFGRQVAYQPRCSVRHTITSERLTKRHLRRRWYGLGWTARALNEKRNIHFNGIRRVRGVSGVLRLLLRACGLWLVGRRAEAFEEQLRAIRAVGYFRSPHEETEL